MNIIVEHIMCLETALGKLISLQISLKAYPILKLLFLKQHLFLEVNSWSVSHYDYLVFVSRNLCEVKLCSEIMFNNKVTWMSRV